MDAVRKLSLLAVIAALAIVLVSPAVDCGDAAVHHRPQRNDVVLPAAAVTLDASPDVTAAFATPPSQRTVPLPGTPSTALRC